MLFDIYDHQAEDTEDGTVEELSHWLANRIIES